MGARQSLHEAAIQQTTALSGLKFGIIKGVRAYNFSVFFVFSILRN